MLLNPCFQCHIILCTGKLCSGHGTCECGQCKCDEDANGQYSGRHCEDCPTCPGKCQELKGCVQCKQFQSGELHDKKVNEVLLTRHLTREDFFE